MIRDSAWGRRPRRAKIRARASVERRFRVKSRGVEGRGSRVEGLMELA
jgi:hypothetical protein